MSDSDNVAVRILVYSLWLLVSFLFAGCAVHEAGHLSYVLLFKYPSPVTYEWNWFGFAPVSTGILPTLGLFQLDSMLPLIPGIASGGIAEATYYYLVNRLLVRGYEKVGPLRLLSLTAYYMASMQLVYAAMEVLRNLFYLPSDIVIVQVVGIVVIFAFPSVRGTTRIVLSQGRGKLWQFGS